MAESGLILLFHVRRDGQAWQHALSYQSDTPAFLDARQQQFVANTDHALLSNFPEVLFVGAMAGSWEKYERIYTDYAEQLYCPQCHKNVKGK